MSGGERIRRGALSFFVIVLLQSINVSYGFTSLAQPSRISSTRTPIERRDVPALCALTRRANLEKDLILKRKPIEIVSTPLQVDFSNATAVEMAGMSALGLAFSVGVIYTLASANPVSADRELGNRALETVYARVVDAALPRDGTDIISVVLGESIAGFIGALSTAAVSTTLSLRMQVEKKALLVNAVADGDYFLTKAAALPLLTALGVPEVVAGIASVLLATVPYELVKLNSKRRTQRKKAEDVMMDRLLEQQQSEQQKNDRIFQFRSMKASASQGKDAALLVDLSGPQIDKLIDVPEILADVIKWLEFDILRTDFGGAILGASANPGVESAVFGFLAGLSSQLYLDVVRTYTDYGPEDKRLEARTRTIAGWASLYSTECLSTAALFGVYETVKIPVSLFVTGVLSRGVDGCLGSTDIQMCLETYMQDNPAEATLEAQVRSLVTALVSLWDRVALDGPFETQEFTRAAVVQLYNIISHAM